LKELLEKIPWQLKALGLVLFVGYLMYTSWALRWKQYTGDSCKVYVKKVHVSET